MNKKIIKRLTIVVAALSLAAMPLFAQNTLPQQGGVWALIGEWVFFGGQYQVEIEIDDDAEMEVQLRDLTARTETKWKGWWSATADTITFSVYRMETENMVGWEMERKQRLNETWTFTYAIDANGGLVLTCANLPAAVANGVAYQRKW